MGLLNLTPSREADMNSRGSKHLGREDTIPISNSLGQPLKILLRAHLLAPDLGDEVRVLFLDDIPLDLH